MVQTKHKPYGLYERFFKRAIDLIASVCGLIMLSPLLVFLTIIGAIMMKGNPFFTQKRPGKNERIFGLLKFRTMSSEKDRNGKLLPDKDRLNAYGKFLRSTSLDELPELINIAKGDMSIVGPRPLLVRYLPYYTEEEKVRHSIRPGLTGYAQANGRNLVSWDDKLQMDVWYVQHISLKTDIKILLDTVRVVLKREAVEVEGIEALDAYRIREPK